MSTIVGNLSRKRVVKDLGGNIRDMLDEADGGWIIKDRVVVNQEKWEAIQQKKKDEAMAASAVAQAKVDENAPDRTVAAKTAVENLNKAKEQEKKVEKLEGDVKEMKSTLEQILKAVQK